MPNSGITAYYFSSDGCLVPERYGITDGAGNAMVLLPMGVNLFVQANDPTAWDNANSAAWSGVIAGPGTLSITWETAIFTLGI